MTRSAPRTLLGDLGFGEGPRWRDGKLWFSDVLKNKVLTVNLDGRAETVAEVPVPSGLGWTTDGDLLIVSQGQSSLLCLRGGGLDTAADLSGLLHGGNVLNDMVVDGQGRAYVGFDPPEDGPEPTTGIILVAPGEAPRVVVEELIYPNGSVVTPDGRTLIVAETFGARISAFDIQTDGSLANRRAFAELDAAHTPDGIALDAEGAVWAGSFVPGEFLRVAEGGRILDRIDAGGRRAVACALGGPDRRTLFMLVSETTIEDLAKGICRSWIQAIEVDVPGQAGRKIGMWSVTVRRGTARPCPRAAGAQS